MNSHSRVIKANAAAERILKVPEADLLTKAIGEVFAGEDAWVAKTVEKVSKTGEIDISIDTELKLASGTVSINLSVVPLIDIKEEPIGYMLVFEDISAEKRVKSTMSRYMSKDIVDKLLAGGENALGGPHQEVSILFSDIRSFTSISECIGAKETVSMLNSYFSDIVEIIFAHRGILDKYIGDAIMAIFGAPFMGEFDADNAVAVSNEMLKALRRFNRAREEAGKEPIRIGLGINTADVIAGNIGSSKRMEYTVIGDGVNLASRLEGACKYYKAPALFSEFTFRKLKCDIKCREIDLIRVKGKTEPVAIYEALAHHSAESFPNLDLTLSAFQRGVKHYRERNWRSAIISFQEALGYNADDAVSQLYLDRALHYQDNQLGDDWDGVWTMTDK